MDPATIVQIVGTVVSLGDVAVRCIAGLSALKAQFHDAPIIVTSMIGQLHMVIIAQDQLSTLNSSNFGHDPRYHQLASQVGNAFDSFGPILLALGQQLDRYGGIGADQMTAKRRMRFLQGEREMTNLSVLLDRQVNALNLLLHAIQCQTWIQQSEIIARTESQSMLQLAKDCSSSLVGLEDGASFVSETTANISTIFEFDDALRSTSLYQAAERSYLKQAIRARKERDSGNISVRRRATFKFRQAFRGMKRSGSIASPNALYTQKETIVDISRDIIAKSPDSNVLVEEVSLDENLSRGNSGDTSTAGPGIEVQQPSQSYLRTFRFNEPQSQGDSSRLYMYFQNRMPDQNIQPQTAKVQLLGASGGGKTTLVNLLQLFTESSRAEQDEGYVRTLVWHNALDAARAVVRVMEVLTIDPEFTSQVREHLLAPCSDCDRDPAMNPQHATEVARIISSSRFSLGHQRATERSNSFQIHDNAKYYLDHINRLAELATHFAAPTDEDLLRIQVPTTGTHWTALTYHDTQFRLCDVGGDRSERKKWISGFNDVSAVIYPVDTTGYNKVLREDPTSNQMQEQFKIFANIANSKRFERSNFIVVLTKTDLLEQYLEKWDVSAFFRDNKIPQVAFPGTLETSAAGSYLSILEYHFRQLIRPESVRERVRFIRADLVGVDNHNSAIAILDELEKWSIRKWFAPSGDVAAPAGWNEAALGSEPVNCETDKLSSDVLSPGTHDEDIKQTPIGVAI